MVLICTQQDRKWPSRRGLGTTRTNEILRQIRSDAGSLRDLDTLRFETREARLRLFAKFHSLRVGALEKGCAMPQFMITLRSMHGARE